MSEIEDQLREQFERQVARPDPNASERMAQVRSRAVARTRNRRAAVGASATALVVLVGVGLVGPLNSNSGSDTKSAAVDGQGAAPGGGSGDASGWVTLDEPIRLTEFSGLAHATRVASPVEVVNVWAEWCGPCIEDLPTMQAAFSGGEVDVFGVSIDSEPTTSRRTLQAAGVTYPNLEDTTGKNESELRAAFGNLGYPLTLGVKDGLVFAVHSGQFDSVAGVEYAVQLADRIPEALEPLAVNSEVTARTLRALSDAGAKGLVTTPGYEREDNTSVEGTWRGLPLRVYVVPSQLAVRGELRVVGRRPVGAQTVAVLQVQDGGVRYLRFRRGGDTWLVASLNPSKEETDLERTSALTASLLAES